MFTSAAGPPSLPHQQPPQSLPLRPWGRAAWFGIVGAGFSWVLRPSLDPEVWKEQREQDEREEEEEDEDEEEGEG